MERVVAHLATWLAHDAIDGLVGALVCAIAALDVVILSPTYARPILTIPVGADAPSLASSGGGAARTGRVVSGIALATVAAWYGVHTLPNEPAPKPDETSASTLDEPLSSAPVNSPESPATARDAEEEPTPSAAPSPEADVAAFPADSSSFRERLRLPLHRLEEVRSAAPVVGVAQVHDGIVVATCLHRGRYHRIQRLVRVGQNSRKIAGLEAASGGRGSSIPCFSASFQSAKSCAALPLEKAACPSSVSPVRSSAC